jgi:hypothetical protein
VNDKPIPIAVFRLGRIVTTLNARELLLAEDVSVAIQRHQAGDWGDVSQEEQAANEQALTQGNQVVSAYKSSGGTTFLLITEGDRSITTVLLPEDR